MLMMSAFARRTANNNNLYKRASEQSLRHEGEQGKRNDESACVVLSPEPGESQIIEHDYQSSMNDCSLNQIDEFFKKPDVSSRRVDYSRQPPDDDELSQSRIEFAVQTLTSCHREDEEEDGRIMAYLERTDIDARRADNLSGIDAALNNFLGGFSDLRSEISQLKDTLRSSQDTKSVIKFIY